MLCSWIDELFCTLNQRACSENVSNVNVDSLKNASNLLGNVFSVKTSEFSFWKESTLFYCCPRISVHHRTWANIFCVCMCVYACSFSGPELNLPPQAFVDVLPQLKVWYILLRFFFCPLLWRDRNPSEGKIKHDCYPGPTSESVQKFQISCKSEWALRSLVNSQIFYIFFFLCVSFTIFSWAFYGPHSHPCTLKYIFLSF